ncbi:hypothetical protein GGI43DRAFT_410485, partial [Trichoderma evansii]
MMTTARPKWAALLDAFLFSRLILIIRMMSSKAFYWEIFCSRYSKGRIDMPCGRPRRPGWSEGASSPHKGVLCCPLWDGCLIIRHPSRLGRGALLTVLKATTNQDIQMLCSKQNCFLKVAPGAFGLHTYKL